MELQSMTAAEIAEMTGKSRQAVDKIAKKNNWLFEEAAGLGRGGKIKKYLINSLPADIQTAIKQQKVSALLAAATPAQLPSVRKKANTPARRKLEQLGLPINEYADCLTDKQRDCAHARMAIVAEVLKMHEVAGLKITEAVVYVVQQIEIGSLPEPLAGFVAVANARANNKRGIGVRTLKEWVSLYRGATSPMERLIALAPGKTKQTRKLNEIG